MKKLIDWKLFFILFGACLLTTLMVLPYTISLLPPEAAAMMTPPVLIAQVLSSQTLFSLTIFVGLWLAKRVGLGLPILSGWLRGERQGKNLKAILRPAIGWGVLAGLLIILLSFLFQSLSIELLKTETAVPVWKSFLASFYGGIAEEVLLRLGLMTLLVWLATKVKSTGQGQPTNVGVWLAIILSSIIFGLGHLPITGALTTITPLVVARAIILNGVAGLIFGWLYWKKGLEAAMISHFSADVVIHVILPTIVSLLV